MSLRDLTPAAAPLAALAAGVAEPALHPVYRDLASRRPQALMASGPAAASTDLAPRDLALVARHVTAPALLVVAVQAREGRRTLRVGLHADGATLESELSGEHAGAVWRSIAMSELPAAIADALPAGPLAAPAVLTQRGGEEAVLRPTPELLARIDAARGPDGSMREIPSDPGADPRLLDALTADGDRVSVALTLHRPDDPARPVPASFTRLWTVGRRGLYRLDVHALPTLEVLPVAAGDVLGTILPLLDQGLAFAVGQSAHRALSR